MEIERTNRINALLEFYSPLLNEKQTDYIRLYYADNYSLGEIADEFQVSRQAVFDSIKRTEKILEHYEEQLHLLANYHARNQLLNQLQEILQKKYASDQELLAYLERIRKIDED